MYTPNLTVLGLPRDIQSFVQMVKKINRVEFLDLSNPKNCTKSLLYTRLFMWWIIELLINRIKKDYKDCRETWRETWQKPAILLFCICTSRAEIIQPSNQASLIAWMREPEWTYYYGTAFRFHCTPFFIAEDNAWHPWGGFEFRPSAELAKAF